MYYKGRVIPALLYLHLYNFIFKKKTVLSGWWKEYWTESQVMGFNPGSTLPAFFFFLP